MHKILSQYFVDINGTMLPRGHNICLQIFSTIFANLINVTYGLTIGWFVIYASKFATFENPLIVPPLQYDEIRWIDLSFYIGALFGTIFLTLNSDVFGRKYTLIVLIVPQGFGWLLKMLSTNATETYLGGFLSGFSAGGSINLVILFVAELADDKIRGRLGTLLALSINAGILISFIADIMLSYLELVYVTFAVLFVFFCTYAIFPDTPRQLYKIRRKEQAVRSLQLYRDIRDLECQTDDCYQIEVKKIRKTLILERGFDFRKNSKAIYKSFVTSLILVSLCVYVNWFIVFSLTNYQDIKQDRIDVSAFRMIIATFQCVGSLLCLVLVDFIEIKYLLFASIAGVTISQIVFGILTFFSLEYIYLPEITIGLVAFCFHFGIYPLTFILIPEMVPEQVRIYGVSAVTTIFWMFMLIFSFNERIIFESLEQRNGTFTACILFNLICAMILWIIVPPTKKRTYSDILRSL